LNQYNVYSAWFDVDYGGCKYGIFSTASPIEPLHSLKNGLIADCLKVLFDEELSGPVSKATLDTLIKKMCTWDRQFYLSSGSQKSMPILLWKNRISNISNTPAREKVGMMLSVIVLSLTTEGKSFFDTNLQRKNQCQDMQEMFQILLCYWAWLKSEVFWKKGSPTSKQRYKASICLMLNKLYDLWPRSKGQGWDKPKFHEQLHIPDDIERNGSPNSTSTQLTEHNHIEVIKNPAKCTQCRQLMLDKQIAN